MRLADRGALSATAGSMGGGALLAQAPSSASHKTDPRLNPCRVKGTSRNTSIGTKALLLE
jgi:hypothetical protein